MSGAAAGVPRERTSAGRVHLYAAAGGFLRRINTAQADELIAAGLAEWRGADLRMIELERYRPGLDGLKVVRHDTRTAANVRGIHAFRSGMLPA